MILPQLQLREQILLAVVFIVLVLGSYTYFRFIPEHENIVKLKTQAAATERRLLKSRIPDEPIENIDTLIASLEDQEQAMELVQDQARAIEQQLAGFDSQELKVHISKLANDSGAQIRVNQRFKPINTINRSVKNAKKKKKKKKKAQPVVQATDLILPETNSWIERMSAVTMFHRPMQQLELIGDYQSLQKFIYGLSELPWQVTVVRIKIDKMPTVSPYGYAQLLQAELVLAL